jgi:hypothetical protein
LLRGIALEPEGEGLLHGAAHVAQFEAGADLTALAGRVGEFAIGDAHFHAGAVFLHLGDGDGFVRAVFEWKSHHDMAGVRGRGYRHGGLGKEQGGPAGLRRRGNRPR